MTWNIHLSILRRQKSAWSTDLRWYVGESTIVIGGLIYLTIGRPTEANRLILMLGEVATSSSSCKTARSIGPGIAIVELHTKSISSIFIERVWLAKSFIKYDNGNVTRAPWAEDRTQRPVLKLCKNNTFLSWWGRKRPKRKGEKRENKIIVYIFYTTLPLKIAVFLWKKKSISPICIVIFFMLQYPCVEVYSHNNSFFYESSRLSSPPRHYGDICFFRDLMDSALYYPYCDESLRGRYCEARHWSICLWPFLFSYKIIMTLSQNIKAQLSIISDIHENGITEQKLEALHSLGLQETLFLTFTIWK